MLMIVQPFVHIQLVQLTIHVISLNTYNNLSIHVNSRTLPWVSVCMVIVKLHESACVYIVSYVCRSY